MSSPAKLESIKRYYQRNKDKIAAQKKKYYEENKDRIRESRVTLTTRVADLEVQVKKLQEMTDYLLQKIEDLKGGKDEDED